MIRISRPDAPEFLTDPNGDWVKETNEAVQHYANNPNTPFKFKKYNDRKVKDALLKVFVKCAYCETSYGAVYDGDVEHFRPKGKVNEKNPQTPGYYWLANSWSNLYLSCQHCNQRRRHILHGDEELQAYGKLDQFPLTDETSRITGPESNETAIRTENNARLLLDPCEDNPAEHFAYEPVEGLIVALSEKGVRSVEVYALKRPHLVRERKKIMLKLFEQMDLVRLTLKTINENPSSNSAQKSFERSLDILLKYTVADHDYAGMCRFFVGKFLRENGLN